MGKNDWLFSLKKMKRVILLFLVLCPALCYCQTYSSVIPDSAILQFVDWEVTNTPKYNERWFTGSKKIYKRVVSWKKAQTSMFDMDGSLEFRKRFEEFFKESKTFNEEDIDFLVQQYESEKKAKWETSFDKGIRTSSRMNSYQMTIPLFSKDMNKVMFWKYFLCGSLCAEACLYVYEREGTVWKLKSTHSCYWS